MPSLDVPVSLHVFNRPELTRKLFGVIRTVQPKYLFVTADGPRESNAKDEEKCRLVREIVEENINWDCEVVRNYSPENKGSYRCTREGITWLFEHVDEAIILEDDCLPNVEFFRFCDQLLEYYRYDRRVSMISGNNFSNRVKGYPFSYYFSKYLFGWGWATWKRTWDLVDHELKGWDQFRDNEGLKTIFDRPSVRYHWEEKFQAMYEGRSAKHWDRELVLATFMENTLSVLPRVNLVSNIGAGEDATHFKRATKRHNVPTEELSFPLVHPHNMYRMYRVEEELDKKCFSGGHSMLRQMVNKKIKQTGLLSKFGKLLAEKRERVSRPTNMKQPK